MDRFAETKPVVALAFGGPLVATLGVTVYEVDKRYKKHHRNNTDQTKMSAVAVEVPASNIQESMRTGVPPASASATASASASI
jgi:hypothetical protein